MLMRFLYKAEAQNIAVGILRVTHLKCVCMCVHNETGSLDEVQKNIYI